MPFKAKPVVTLGKGDWAVEVPRPPKHATHARLTLRDYFKDNGQPREAVLPLNDFGCFKGVAGDFQYIRMDKKGKVSEEYKDTWFWNGYKVEGIEELI